MPHYFILKHLFNVKIYKEIGNKSGTNSNTIIIYWKTTKFNYKFEKIVETQPKDALKNTIILKKFKYNKKLKLTRAFNSAKYTTVIVPRMLALMNQPKKSIRKEKVDTAPVKKNEKKHTKNNTKKQTKKR